MMAMAAPTVLAIAQPIAMPTIPRRCIVSRAMPRVRMQVMACNNSMIGPPSR